MTDTEIAGTEVAAGDKVVSSTTRPTATRPCSTIRIASTSVGRRTPTSPSGVASITASGRTSPGSRIRLLFEELFVRFADVRLADEPVYMHSMFFNGVERQVFPWGAPAAAAPRDTDCRCWPCVGRWLESMSWRQADMASRR